jgi:hypothetical protein
MFENGFSKRKANLRRKSKEQLELLKQEITTAALSRHFTLAELSKTRYRFQPHRLHRANSQDRGAAD